MLGACNEIVGAPCVRWVAISKPVKYDLAALSVSLPDSSLAGAAGHNRCRKKKACFIALLRSFSGNEINCQDPSRPSVLCCSAICL